jgi:antitoxin VapB
MEATAGDRAAEVATKHGRVLAFLDALRLDALLLRRVSSFAWATGGARSYVNIANQNGAAALLVTRSGRHLFTDNLEAARLREEEGLAGQGWEFHTREWHEPLDLRAWTRGLRVGADGPGDDATDVSAALGRLRGQLLPVEAARLAELSAAAAAAVTDAARSIAAGQTEQDVSARLAYEAERRGLQAITNIVATDDRIERFRHALPTDRPVGRHTMLVLNARRWGLVTTVTRFVHRGAPPEPLRAAHADAARLAAQCIAATRPDVPLGSVFAALQDWYDQIGLPDGWRIHHQGGAAGYEPREWFITPEMVDCAHAGQGYVWNPSVGAARSVDTFLVDAHANRILTADPRWPTCPVEVAGQTVARPALLILD